MGAHTVIHPEESSIKTLKVVGPRRQVTMATLGFPQIMNAQGSWFSYELEGAVNFCEPLEGRLIFDALRGTGREDAIKAGIGSAECFHVVKVPNAVADVVPELRDQQLAWLHTSCLFVGVGFSTSPLIATVNVVDKKYSEVFQEIFSLRNPEDEDDPHPTEFSYWAASRVVAAAYQILKLEDPRSVELVKPTAVVDDTGGVRLIWRTHSKLVKANFGGRSDLKSYLYYESGQLYDIETLDAPTLARRLRWLI